MDPTVALRWFARLGEEEIQDFMESPKKVDTTSAPLVASGASSSSNEADSKTRTLTIKQKLGLLQAGIYMLCCKCVLCKKKKSIEESEELPIEKSYLLLGCGPCGKSTLLHRFSTLNFKEKLEENSISPTNGFSVKQVKYKNALISFWELGGSEKIRKYWPRYVEKELFDGLIYVVDASLIDNEGGGLSESTSALENFLKNVGRSTYQRWHSKPIFIVLNKIDLQKDTKFDRDYLIGTCRSKFSFVLEYFCSCSFFCTTCFALPASSKADDQSILKYSIDDVRTEFERALSSFIE